MTSLTVNANMKIAIAGMGFVGLSNAVLLAQHNPVVALDLVQSKVDQVNARQSPIEDAELQHYLANKPLSLRATTSAQDAFAGADYVVIATPTDDDLTTNVRQHSHHLVLAAHRTSPYQAESIGLK